MKTPDFRGWQRVHTEYTEIIFEPHDSEYAREVASFADEVYASVVDLVGYTPDTRIPVVLTNRPAWANGYYRPLPHRIVLFFHRRVKRCLVLECRTERTAGGYRQAA